jgi:hypothetical protein
VARYLDDPLDPAFGTSPRRGTSAIACIDTEE